MKAATTLSSALGIAALTLSSLTLSACKSGDGSQPQGHASSSARIGTYDGRAIAIAYANGPRFGEWMAALKKAHDAAKESGDSARMAELEAKAAGQQERFHGQAFAGDDIDDVLSLVADALPKILADANVSRLEKVNRERASDIQTVDVTDQLVDLFAPSDKGRQWIAEMREKPFSK